MTETISIKKWKDIKLQLLDDMIDGVSGEFMRIANDIPDCADFVLNPDGFITDLDKDGKRIVSTESSLAGKKFSEITDRVAAMRGLAATYDYLVTQYHGVEELPDGVDAFIPPKPKKG
ncbi:hypothetical protein [Schleiferilactobacillus perolens]|uniref:Phage protein n=1 Tax=Schleiferilactobacillus perolens DSM 12744 TaxID=1423792 RepID=A0A0R1MXZ4_9LACO|nr:hypothetical protein [Schleiferilactobacillus perolens]KRL13031.1 hypothetical protein FD09_GL002571 [Schleiferilactobacillus perolens DSM 12744]